MSPKMSVKNMNLHQLTTNIYKNKTKMLKKTPISLNFSHRKFYNEKLQNLYRDIKSSFSWLIKLAISHK